MKTTLRETGKEIERGNAEGAIGKFIAGTLGATGILDSEFGRNLTLSVLSVPQMSFEYVNREIGMLGNPNLPGRRERAARARSCLVSRLVLFGGPARKRGRD
jgi:hypothetical protein